MNSIELRQSFLDFFKSKGHNIVRSASLLPESPNLLFTNAGMNQFVPIFLGERVPQFHRVADTQKCIRAGGKHNDLEDVGFDTYHHTFFEMLGNWSFGDYFKKEAIEFAWELLTKVWKMPKSRLYVTVYNPDLGDPAEFDRESYSYWEQIFQHEGLDPTIHILKFGKKENFWMMGDTGPCGPCSEIHIDLTPSGGTKGSLVNCGSSSCIEIWNLVFMQFNAQGDGIFSGLREKHVDTGMGFERVVGIFSATKNFTDFSRNPSNYDSDLFLYIFDEISALSGKKYHGTVTSDRRVMSEQEKIDFAFRVIADHMRTLTFAIADVILPGNEGRHYVLRRILRRAVIFSKRLGLPPGSFREISERVIERMSPIFPELEERRETVLKTIHAEETMFEKTLSRGMALLEDIFSKSLDQKIGGFDAFTLYDTYGFPFDLTQLMAQERGFTVDEVGFHQEMNQQRELARNAQKKLKITITADNGTAKTEFFGHKKMELVGVKVQQVIFSGDYDFLLTDKTPFYGEMGGEVGDTGDIIFCEKRIEVLDSTQDTYGNILHKILPNSGLKTGDDIALVVNAKRRNEIQRHHTATHLMHAALREVLGMHVKQSGSHVDDEGLRFDFNHFAAMATDEIGAVEEWVNDAILRNLKVDAREMQFTEIPENCIAHFNEKYGEVVRVLSIGDLSTELCGGCHVLSTGELGFFKIVRESAIASGIRRIEAVVGESARKYVDQKIKIVEGLLKKFSAKDSEIFPKIQQLEAGKTSAEHRLRSVLQSHNRKILEQSCAKIQKKDDLSYLVSCFEIDTPNDLRPLSNMVMKQNGVDVVIFAGNLTENSVIVVACSDVAVKQNCQASDVIKKIAERFNGKGGGSAFFGMINFQKPINKGEVEDFVSQLYFCEK